ncbi:MAG TPA: hypothetical protein VFB12_10600 [Ktedonobacteraceae bacterium]|nr:hypothetical protein [Ktedonobacteraceae bacterium]
MENPRDAPMAETKHIAERLLSEKFAAPIRLDEGIALQERTYVTRFNLLESPQQAPASVIVKRARLKDGSFDPNTSGWLFNDWAALQFLSEVAETEPVGPRFYTGDLTVGLFIMEDLGSGESPDKSLLGSDAQDAEHMLIDLATQLGRMHALTIGKRACYEHIRRSLGPSARVGFHDYQSLPTRLYFTAQALGVSLHKDVEKELAYLVATLTDPGPFLAYTHGDPCPDNWFSSAGKLRLFDYEVGAYRHALLDGVYGRIHFPTCWCVARIPHPIPVQMEQAYRTELVKGCPEASDDKLFSQAVVDACAFWVLALCATDEKELIRLRDEDWLRGPATVRQRTLLRFDIFSRSTQEFAHLPALGAAFAELAAKLRSLWPPEADTMPYYPAFHGLLN